MPLILHAETSKQLADVVARPPQALIISGPRGIGKSSIVQALAKQLLGAEPETHRYYKHIAGSDGIEVVRQLQAFMALRTVGASTAVDRIAVISDADELSIEAENALLKLLEEPPAGALLILTTSQAQQLLPTIHSRSQLLTITKPDRDALQAHFVAAGHDAPQVVQAIQLGQGLPGMITAILSEEAGNTTRQAVEQARDILRSSAFDRVALVDSLSKQKPLAIETVHMLGQMADGALKQLATTRPPDALKRAESWQRILRTATDTEARLLSNGQTKLVLTDFMLSLP